MPNTKETAEWKARYTAYSDAQLIEVKHQWLETAEQHIAAVQLLHERESASKARAETRAEYSLSISRAALSNSFAARRISTFALIVGAIAIIISAIANRDKIASFIIEWFPR